MIAISLIWLLVSAGALGAKALLIPRIWGSRQERPMRYLLAFVAGGIFYDVLTIILAVRAIDRAVPGAPPTFGIVAITIGHLIQSVPAIIFAGYMLGLLNGHDKEQQNDATHLHSE